MALESLRNGIGAVLSLMKYRGSSVSNDINKNHVYINKNHLLICTFK